ncbi:2-oxoglutarate-dependent ethylene/succinate-forming enzyme [Marinomonas spartinae]|uniref:2-oxoglutarate-dependent ethylene/succinate-forming enzyme n=1 Tax=Marinomonas spartinae TaxID=1792290 RepID=A0A1A8TM59_9GAMM|nr:2-oxoglutarate and iron-dependent oxygenase domain-containing protein [Marinomonas spartinae]SBS33640.1 2-oxoglutarate-dependent ethylene/succinate-forming enzyme [Marinomonas spartinae]
MSIPLIDFEKLTSSNQAVSQEEIQALDSACREIGFFYLVNSSLSPALMKKLMGAAQRFFAQPDKVKRAIDIKNSPNHRGYGGIGEEQLDEVSHADWKETFDMALDLAKDHPLVGKYPAMYGPNQNPSDPLVVEVLQDYYVAAFEVAQKVLMAMAQALKLEPGFFTRCFTDHVTVLRMIHYPPRPADDHHNGAGAHTDYGCITLLLQDMIGGLQVKNRRGEWVDATPVENALVVNIGDLMQRWTNDEYVSTSHRVVSPLSGVDRYSFPFFVEPDYETNVACVPSCFSADKPAKYAPILSGDWIQSRFDATYAYREKSSS